MPDEVDNVYTSSESEGNGEVKDMAQRSGGRDGEAPGLTPGKKSSSSKDPSRPKRKKARRACHACQRAHLTCGDERPCTRCIKRGLQNSCHDGTRKKAKYLHDAPNEALLPAAARIGPFADLSEHGVAMAVPSGPMSEAAAQRVANPQGFYSLDQSISPQAYDAYAQNGGMSQPMAPPPPSSSRDLSSQQSPTTPGFPPGQQQQQPPPPTATISVYPGGMPQSSPVTQAQPQNGVGGPMYDPNDPSVFNFDLASMNFGNHYGALEFGMLGHMSSAAMGSPSVDDSSMDQAQAQAVAGSGIGPGGVVPPTFNQSPNSANYMFTNDAVMADWPQGGRTDVNEGPFSRNNGTMPGRVNASIAHGYTIGNGIGFAEAGAGQGFPAAFAGASSAHPAYAEGANGHGHADADYHGHGPHASAPTMDASGLQPLNGQAAGGARMRDSSTVYDAVTEPYSYTAGFHALTAYLQRRFPPHKTLRIAKALASIRPSFISCTKTLNQEDLIFMEKCFQRMLWEYENFIGACATPTIVCRRTGEVAAVGNEFTILTGWRKDVLLGKEANLNVNGGAGSTANSGSSSRGFTTPRPVASADGGKPREALGAGANARPQPVFLAELLDDDSVIKFYEDFAKLAFGDSRGSITTRCRLLKYKTRADLDFGGGGAEGDDPGGGDDEGGGSNGDGGPSRPDYDGQYNQASSATGLSKGGIASEGSIHRLESHDGTVECICCWTVRRDVFDIPMLIVMNFLPCI